MSAIDLPYMQTVSVAIILGDTRLAFCIEVHSSVDTTLSKVAGVAYLQASVFSVWPGSQQSTRVRVSLVRQGVQCTVPLSRRCRLTYVCKHVWCVLPVMGDEELMGSAA